MRVFDVQLKFIALIGILGVEVVYCEICNTLRQLGVATEASGERKEGALARSDAALSPRHDCHWLLHLSIASLSSS